MRSEGIVARPAVWGPDVPYSRRQVWAGYADVPEDTCRGCSYFEEVYGGYTSWGQVGVCHFGRQEADDFNMQGMPSCVFPRLGNAAL